MKIEKNNQKAKINLQNITYKTEELLDIVNNRYKITIQVANRAKRRKYEDIDIIDDALNKPIIKAIIEIVDEIIEPEILED